MKAIRGVMLSWYAFHPSSLIATDHEREFPTATRL